MNRVALLRFAISAAAVYLAWALRSVLAPLFAAYLLMLVLQPLHARFAKRMGSSLGAVATVLVMLFTPMVLIVAAWFGSAELSQWFSAENTASLKRAVSEQVAATIELLPEPVRERFDADGSQREAMVHDSIERSLAMLPGALSGIGRFFGGAFGILAGLLLVPVFVYFLLQGAPWLPRVRREIPPEWHVHFDSVLPPIERILQLYLVSRLKVAAIKGLLAFVPLFLLGFPGAFTLAFLLGAFSLLPVLGPIVAFVALSAVAFVDGGVTGGGIFGLLVALAIYAALEMIEGYVLLPRVVGKELGMSDFAVIVAVLCGGALAGILGLVIAIPAVAVGKVLYDEFVRPVLATQREREAEATAVADGSG